MLNSLLLLVPLVLAGGDLAAPSASTRVTGPAQAKTTFDHSHAALTRVLAAHVDGDRFDYRALVAAPAELDGYLAGLSAVAAKDFKTWSEDQRFAFWVNAYNGWTLQLIRDNYTRDGKTLASIRDLKDPWKRRFIPLPQLDPEGKGRKLSLDDIEHAILRKRFKDARVHAAVNCASISCPPLRAEAFQAASLDTQLDEQVRTWLGDTSRNALTPVRGRVQVSKIFEWFRRDFGANDQQVLEWIMAHAPEGIATPLRGKVRDLTVRTLDYDWGLNDIVRAGGGKK